jgi:hypothetical protein
MALTSLDQKPDGWLSPSLWQDAEKILRHSDDFNDIELICKFLLRPQDAMRMLSKRPQHWLDAFLDRLYGNRRIAKLLFDSPASKAIVDFVWGPSPSGEGWNGYWILKALKALTPDITSVAARFDAQIHVTLRKIPFPYFVLWLIGNQNSFISDFTDSMFNLSGTLAQYVGEDHFKDALILLLQASLFPGKAPWLSLT